MASVELVLEVSVALSNPSPNAFFQQDGPAEDGQPATAISDDGVSELPIEETGVYIAVFARTEFSEICAGLREIGGVDWLTRRLFV